MKHELSFEILEQKDCNILSLLDTSIYLEDVPITSPIIKIFPPNWDKYISLPLVRSQINLIRPSNIRYKTFPGGIYSIEISICPNAKVYHKQCYLHICNELKLISQLACDSDNYEELFDIRMKLETAQDMVYDGNVKEGTTLYNIAVKELNKIKQKDCGIC